MADHVLALTGAGRDDLISAFRLDPERVTALGSNAVLTTDMLARIARTPRRPEPGLVAAVGRLSPEKGLDTLIDAAAIAAKRHHLRRRDRRRGPNAGGVGGADRTTGPLPGPSRWPALRRTPSTLLRRAALFVSASTHEGLGNAIIEAMACGVPVVATDAPHGPREVLSNGAYGRLVPVGDAPALAASIVEALDNPANPSLARTRAHAYTDEAAARAFLAVLDTARAEGRGH